VRFLLLCLVALFVNALALGQGQAAGGNSGKWLRVESDNGEFSIDVPAHYKYYFNSDGLWLSTGSSYSYHLEKMSVLNSFEDETLISFESYEASKGALNAIYTGDKRDNTRESQTKKDGHSIRDIITENDKFYLVRRYFNSKTHIYVLTAASRKGRTTEIQHFLDSMVFTPDVRQTDSGGAVGFSSLEMTEIPVQFQPPSSKPGPPRTPAQPVPPKDQNETSVIVLSKPRASYVDKARAGNVQGVIRLKLVFAEDGSIPNIVVLNDLPGGLLRQTLLSAIRIKFLPKEINGKPVSTIVTFEYSFTIY